MSDTTITAYGRTLLFFEASNPSANPEQRKNTVLQTAAAEFNVRQALAQFSDLAHCTFWPAPAAATISFNNDPSGPESYQRIVGACTDTQQRATHWVAATVIFVPTQQYAWYYSLVEIGETAERDQTAATAWANADPAAPHCICDLAGFRLRITLIDCQGWDIGRGIEVNLPTGMAYNTAQKIHDASVRQVHDIVRRASAYTVGPLIRASGEAFAGIYYRQYNEFDRTTDITWRLEHGRWCAYADIAPDAPPVHATSSDLPPSTAVHDQVWRKIRGANAP